MLVSRFLCLNVNANMYQDMAQVGESQLRLLSFHPRTNGTIHKVALEDEEKHQHRDGVEHRTSDQQVVL